MPDTTGGNPLGIVAMMVTPKQPTRIHQHHKGRLFLREHRKAKHVSAPDMAGRLGIERTSVYRQEREWWRVNPQEWADALGIAAKSLYSPPGAVSLDDLVEDQPEEVKKMAVDIVKRLVTRG